MSESSGLFQCSLELTGSVDLYEFGLLGDVGLFHPVDYYLGEVGFFLHGGWKGGGKLVFGF